jgi:hypothetical protein
MKPRDVETKHRWHHRTIEDHRNELGGRAAVAIRRQNGQDRDQKVRQAEIAFLARLRQNNGPGGA